MPRLPDPAEAMALWIGTSLKLAEANRTLWTGVMTASLWWLPALPRPVAVPAPARGGRRKGRG